MGLRGLLCCLLVLRVQRTHSVFFLLVRTGYGRKAADLYTMTFRFFNNIFKMTKMSKEVLWKQ